MGTGGKAACPPKFYPTQKEKFFTPVREQHR